MRSSGPRRRPCIRAGGGRSLDALPCADGEARSCRSAGWSHTHGRHYLFDMRPSRVIVVAGQRLALARFQATDHAAVHEFASDPEVCRFTTWGPNTDAETRAFIDGATTVTEGELQLAVMRDHDVIGSAAVWTTSASDRTGELGYVLSRRHWGQGYATEVAQMLVKLGFERLGLERLGATCHPDNAASIRVLEKCGMQREGRLRGHLMVRGQRRDSVAYGLLATDRTS